MNKTELEEKIKNGESVWGLYQSHKEIEEMYFSKENKYKFMDVKYIDGGTELCLVVNNDWYYPLKYLFKTKAEAEHYLHHANVKRTEQLPFYTFSEIAKDEKNFKMGKTYTLIEDKNFVLDINKSYVSQIVLYTGKEKYSWNFNEANFYKAYDECVRLFKGEE